MASFGGWFVMQDHLLTILAGTVDSSFFAAGLAPVALGLAAAMLNAVWQEME